MWILFLFIPMVLLAALAQIATEDGSEEITIPETLDWIERTLATSGLDALTDWRFGDLMAFRRYELAMALNRLRSLRVD